MKITKGNWFAKDGQIYPEQTGKTIAIISYFDKDNEEHIANQQLLAAAPDMLDACQKALLVIQGHEKQGQIIRTLQQVIDKATL